jgi:hypothetical protein
MVKLAKPFQFLMPFKNKRYDEFDANKFSKKNLKQKEIYLK